MRAHRTSTAGNGPEPPVPLDPDTPTDPDDPAEPDPPPTHPVDG